MIRAGYTFLHVSFLLVEAFVVLCIAWDVLKRNQLIGFMTTILAYVLSAQMRCFGGCLRKLSCKNSSENAGSMLNYNVRLFYAVYIQHAAMMRYIFHFNRYFVSKV